MDPLDQQDRSAIYTMQGSIPHINQFMAYKPQQGAVSPGAPYQVKQGYSAVESPGGAYRMPKEVMRYSGMETNYNPAYMLHQGAVVGQQTSPGSYQYAGQGYQGAQMVANAQQVVYQDQGINAHIYGVPGDPNCMPRPPIQQVYQNHPNHMNIACRRPQTPENMNMANHQIGNMVPNRPQSMQYAGTSHVSYINRQPQMVAQKVQYFDSGGVVPVEMQQSGIQFTQDRTGHIHAIMQNQPVRPNSPGYSSAKSPIQSMFPHQNMYTGSAMVSVNATVISGTPSYQSPTQIGQQQVVLNSPTSLLSPNQQTLNYMVYNPQQMQNKEQCQEDYVQIQTINPNPYQCNQQGLMQNQNIIMNHANETWTQKPQIANQNPGPAPNRLPSFGAQTSNALPSLSDFLSMKMPAITSHSIVNTVANMMSRPQNVASHSSQPQTVPSNVSMTTPTTTCSSSVWSVTLCSSNVNAAISTSNNVTVPSISQVKTVSVTSTVPVCSTVPLKSHCDTKTVCDKKLESPKSILNEKQRSIQVPYGWKREIKDGAIVYYSPSNTALTSFASIREYLLSEGTCKCGLECPLIVEKLFCFDSEVFSELWNIDRIKTDDNMTKLCNHKRKIIAMATLQKSALQHSIGELGRNDICTSKANKKDLKKKKRRSNSSAFDGVLVSQLLAQRDKLQKLETHTNELSDDKNLVRQSESVSERLKSEDPISNPVSSPSPNIGHKVSSSDLPFPSTAALRALNMQNILQRQRINAMSGFSEQTRHPSPRLGYPGFINQFQSSDIEPSEPRNNYASLWEEINGTSPTKKNKEIKVEMTDSPCSPDQNEVFSKSPRAKVSAIEDKSSVNMTLIPNFGMQSYITPNSAAHCSVVDSCNTQSSTSTVSNNKPTSTLKEQLEVPYSLPNAVPTSKDESLSAQLAQINQLSNGAPTMLAVSLQNNSQPWQSNLVITPQMLQQMQIPQQQMPMSSPQFLQSPQQLVQQQILSPQQQLIQMVPQQQMLHQEQLQQTIMQQQLLLQTQLMQQSGLQVPQLNLSPHNLLSPIAVAQVSGGQQQATHLNCQPKNPIEMVQNMVSGLEAVQKSQSIEKDVSSAYMTESTTQTSGNDSVSEDTQENSNSGVETPVESEPKPGNINIPSITVNSPMPPMNVPLVTAVTNSLTQVIPAVGLSQQIMAQPQVLQIINALGIAAAVQTPLLIPNQLNMMNSVLPDGQPNPHMTVMQPQVNVSPNAQALQTMSCQTDEARSDTSSPPTVPTTSPDSDNYNNSLHQSITPGSTPRSTTPKTRRRERNKKASTPTIATMLQEQSNSACTESEQPPVQKSDASQPVMLMPGVNPQLLLPGQQMTDTNGPLGFPLMQNPMTVEQAMQILAANGSLNPALLQALYQQSLYNNWPNVINHTDNQLNQGDIKRDNLKPEPPSLAKSPDKKPEVHSDSLTHSEQKSRDRSPHNLTLKISPLKIKRERHRKDRSPRPRESESSATKIPITKGIKTPPIRVKISRRATGYSSTIISSAINNMSSYSAHLPTPKKLTDAMKAVVPVTCLESPTTTTPSLQYETVQTKTTSPPAKKKEPIKLKVKRESPVFTSVKTKPEVKVPLTEPLSVKIDEAPVPHTAITCESGILMPASSVKSSTSSENKTQIEAPNRLSEKSVSSNLLNTSKSDPYAFEDDFEDKDDSTDSKLLENLDGPILSQSTEKLYNAQFERAKSVSSGTSIYASNSGSEDEFESVIKISSKDNQLLDENSDPLVDSHPFRSSSFPYFFNDESKKGIKRPLENDEDDLDNMETDIDDSDTDSESPISRTMFTTGDVVWGQIRGLAWWPGKLVHESEVKGSPKTEEGKVWIKWFGESTYAQLEAGKLKTLSEGLEAHHKEESKKRRSRSCKINSTLESAIQEAMAELDKQTLKTEQDPNKCKQNHKKRKR